MAIQEPSLSFWFDKKSIKDGNENRMHLLDDPVIKAIPILEYCLQLPRNELDVCDCDTTYTAPALPVYSGSIPEGYGVNPTGWVLNKNGNIKDNGYIY